MNVANETLNMDAFIMSTSNHVNTFIQSVFDKSYLRKKLCLGKGEGDIIYCTFVRSEYSE